VVTTPNYLKLSLNHESVGSETD